MKDEISAVENILNNLKEDPMRVIYTENYLEQIKKRNLPDICIEELIENGNLEEIRDISEKYSGFELHFLLDDGTKLQVLIRTFNLNKIILISSLAENTSPGESDDKTLEFVGNYDMAFDLIDFHTKESFKYGQSIEMEKGLNIDFDSCGHPIAVEILRASKKFKVQIEVFSSLLFKGHVEITPELIKLRITAEFTHENIKSRLFESQTANVYGILENTFDLILEILPDSI